MRRGNADEKKYACLATRGLRISRKPSVGVESRPIQHERNSCRLGSCAGTFKELRPPDYQRPVAIVWHGSAESQLA